MMTSEISLAYKLAAGFVVTLFLGILALGWSVLTLQSSLLERQIDDYGVSLTTQFAQACTEPLFTDDAFALQVLSGSLISDEQVLGVAVLDRNGNILVNEGRIPDFQNKRQDLSKTIAWGESGELLRTYITPIEFREVTAGFALATVSTERMRESFTKTLHLFIVSGITIVIVSIILAVMLARRMAQPVADIVDATDSLARGNFNIRLKVRSNDEIGRLKKAVNHMAQSLLKKQQVEGVLSQLVAEDVAQNVMANLDDINVTSERVEATVLFVDIVGFTTIAEKMAPEQVADFLSEYFGYFTAASRLFFGTVDKFIGDCAMVIFGAPRSNGDHRFNALACAVVIQRLISEINLKREAEGLEAVHVRIGINSGEMMAGIVGTGHRMEYTVVGDAVNLASRLCKLAPSGGVVAGEASIHHISVCERVNSKPFQEVYVKGKTEMVATHQVLDVAQDYQRTIDNLIEDVLSVT